VEDSVVNGGGVSAPLLNESCFEREKENIIATSGVVKGRLIVLGQFTPLKIDFSKNFFCMFFCIENTLF